MGKEGLMDSYIVRIYRRVDNIPHKLVGVVEAIGGRGKKAFTNLDELWEILNTEESESEQPKKSKGKN